MRKSKPGYKLVKSSFQKYEEIPEDWDFKKLDEIGEIVGGGTPESNNMEYWNGDVLWAVPTDITKQSSKFIDDTERKISKKGLDESSAKLLPNGTLLITSRATVGECSITTKPISTNQGFQNLICNNENFNEFWYYAIKHHRKRLLRLSYGTTFLEISKNGIKQVSIPTSNSKTEQQKIASVLSNVDYLIESYDKTITQTKSLKTGLMQKLLTKGIGHKKFKKVKWLFGKEIEIPEEWKFSKMNKICTKISVGIATSTTKYFVDKGVPLLRNQNIKKGYVDTSDLLHISEEFAKMNKSKKLQTGDVVCMRTGYPGQSAVVTSEMNGWQTFTTLIIRPDHTILDSNYLVFFLNSFGRKQITSTQAGAAQQNLNAGWMSNLLILIPNTIQEQQEIVSILRFMEDKISELESMKSNLNKIKKGLMQKLLTGQIRVKV